MVPSFLAKYWYDLHLTHKPCNFHIKEVIGEGGLAVYTKRSWIHLFMLTLMHNTIFTKKRSLGRVGLLRLQKGLDSPRLHLTQALYNFRKSRSMGWMSP